MHFLNLSAAIFNLDFKLARQHDSDSRSSNGRGELSTHCAARESEGSARFNRYSAHELNRIFHQENAAKRRIIAHDRQETARELRRP